MKWNNKKENLTTAQRRRIEMAERRRDTREAVRANGKKSSSTRVNHFRAKSEERKKKVNGVKVKEDDNFFFIIKYVYADEGKRTSDGIICV